MALGIVSDTAKVAHSRALRKSFLLLLAGFSSFTTTHMPSLDLLWHQSL
jgi:hypothetical protein